MAEFIANSVQTVNPGESVIFTSNPIPCKRGLIVFRPESGEIDLKGYVLNQSNCPCCRQNFANYLVDFGANIAVPTSGTAEAISVAIAIGGTTIPTSTMIVTPTALNAYNNVSRAINVSVLKNCCQPITVRNTSNQPILVQNANIIITRPDLAVTR